MVGLVKGLGERGEREDAEVIIRCSSEEGRLTYEVVGHGEAEGVDLRQPDTSDSTIDQMG